MTTLQRGCFFVCSRIWQNRRIISKTRSNILNINHHLISLLNKQKGNEPAHPSHAGSYNNIIMKISQYHLKLVLFGFQVIIADPVAPWRFLAIMHSHEFVYCFPFINSSLVM